MKKVFIGGSRRISRLNQTIQSRIDGIIEAGLCVLVGDANGADKAVQRLLAQRGYQHVTIFFSGSDCRNNVGGWTTHSVPVERKKKDFDFYAAKDLAMANEADYGLMLWDGESRGTLNNILKLLDRRKQVVVYFSPQTKCITARNVEDLNPLLEKCSGRALPELSRRLTSGKEGAVSQLLIQD